MTAQPSDLSLELRDPPLVWTPLGMALGVFAASSAGALLLFAPELPLRLARVATLGPGAALAFGDVFHALSVFALFGIGASLLVGAPWYYATRHRVRHNRLIVIAEGAAVGVGFMAVAGALLGVSAWIHTVQTGDGQGMAWGQGALAFAGSIFVFSVLGGLLAAPMGAFAGVVMSMLAFGRQGDGLSRLMERLEAARTAPKAQGRRAEGPFSWLTRPVTPPPPPPEAAYRLFASLDEASAVAARVDPSEEPPRSPDLLEAQKQAAAEIGQQAQEAGDAATEEKAESKLAPAQPFDIAAPEDETPEPSLDEEEPLAEEPVDTTPLKAEDNATLFDVAAAHAPVPTAKEPLESASAPQSQADATKDVVEPASANAANSSETASKRSDEDDAPAAAVAISAEVSEAPEALPLDGVAGPASSLAASDVSHEADKPEPADDVAQKSAGDEDKQKLPEPVREPDSPRWSVSPFMASSQSSASAPSTPSATSKPSSKASAPQARESKPLTPAKTLPASIAKGDALRPAVPLSTQETRKSVSALLKSAGDMVRSMADMAEPSKAPPRTTRAPQTEAKPAKTPAPKKQEAPKHPADTRPAVAPTAAPIAAKDVAPVAVKETASQAPKSDKASPRPAETRLKRFERPAPVREEAPVEAPPPRRSGIELHRQEQEEAPFSAPAHMPTRPTGPRRRRRFSKLPDAPTPQPKSTSAPDAAASQNPAQPAVTATASTTAAEPKTPAPSAPKPKTPKVAAKAAPQPQTPSLRGSAPLGEASVQEAITPKDDAAVALKTPPQPSKQAPKTSDAPEVSAPKATSATPPLSAKREPKPKPPPDPVPEPPPPPPEPPKRSGIELWREENETNDPILRPPSRRR